MKSPVATLRAVVLMMIAATLLASCFLAKIFPTKLTLPATSEWLATGVDVEPGDALRISATGLISISSSVFPDPVTGPDGEDSLPTPEVYEPDNAYTYPLPTARYGALVGRIGSEGEVFFIGAEGYITPDTAGELYLIVNDNYMDNNAGFFDVVITFEDAPVGGALM